MENLVIRRATEDDAENIIKYLNVIGGESDNLSFGEGEIVISLEKEKEIIKSVNNSERNIMLLGIVNGEIASVTSLNSFSRKRDAHKAEVGISVKKKYWRMGIGTRMMQEVIEFAKKINIKIIQLEVKSDNVNAIKLYEKMGFERIGVYKNFSKVGEKYYDFDLMNLYFN